jgi:hypothetical protein
VAWLGGGECPIVQINPEILGTGLAGTWAPDSTQAAPRYSRYGIGSTAA